MEAEHQFDWDKAFSRTIGFITPAELKILRKSRIAIAGLGGVGGVHLTTLARLGVGHFHISDFDRFEIHNFNRQAGAMMSTIGRSKSAVMTEIIHDINPEVTLQVFEQGVTPENIDAFLDNVDLYIDGMDFFAFDVRALIFAACARKGIPATTVAPLGISAALVNFMPGKMTFEEYFQWKNYDDHEKGLRLLLGLSPKVTHRHYLMWPEAVDMKNRKGPSTPMACGLCAGVAATEALKILLRRGKVLSAPHTVVFDAYFNRTVRSWFPWGMSNPFMKIRLFIVRNIMKRIDHRRSPNNVS